MRPQRPRPAARTLSPSHLAGAARHVVPIQVGVIGRRTELVLIPSGHGRMRIVSPHEVPIGEV